MGERPIECGEKGKENGENNAMLKYGAVNYMIYNDDPKNDEHELSPYEMIFFSI